MYHSITFGDKNTWKESKGALCHIVDREAPILQFAEVRKGQGGSGVLDIVDFHGNYSLSASSS